MSANLTVAQFDPALREVIVVLSVGLVLIPVEGAVALGDPELVKMFTTHHQARERKRVEQLVADDELRAAAGNIREVGRELDSSAFPNALQRPVDTPELSCRPQSLI